MIWSLLQQMEVRARRNPHEMPDVDGVTDIPVSMDAWTTSQHRDITTGDKRSARSRPQTQEDNYQYPVKPLFLSKLNPSPL